MRKSNTAGPLEFGVKPAAGGEGDVFRDAERLLDMDPVGAYRQFRDAWLKADFPKKKIANLKSPWKDFWLASLAWNAGRECEALSFLHKASSASTRYSWMRYNIAEILLRRLDLYGLARREIQGVVKNVPWLWEARCLWAEILLCSGVDDALKAVRQVRVPETSRASFLAWRGALGLWSGAYDGAIKDLDIAAELHNHDAFCWRGGARIAAGRLREGKEDLDRLLTMDPHDPEALVWRGEANRLLRRIPESLADLNAVIAQSGDKTWAHVNRALVHLGRGDLNAARQDFARLYPSGMDRDEGIVLACRGLDARRMRALLEAALAAARGCRRSDPHLNLAWMKAAGIPIPKQPAWSAGLLYWLRAMKLYTPEDSELGYPPITEKVAQEALA